MLNKCVSLVLFFSTFLDYILCKCNFNYIFLLIFYFAVNLKKSWWTRPSWSKAGWRQGKNYVLFSVWFVSCMISFIMKLHCLQLFLFFVEIYEGEKETCYWLSCERRCHVGWQCTRRNIARIANAVQVTICLLVSTSVY